MNEDFDLAGKVIGCAMKVHRALGPRFLEVVYKNALCVELRPQGIAFTTEEPIKVRYAGVEVGSYFADVLVEGQLIVELKAVDKLLVIHEVQVVNYHTATGIDDGLLLNFGSRSLDYRRKSRLLPRRRSEPQS
ncbi:MAG: GxxExxY protein [Roseimicrobium sp.]